MVGVDLCLRNSDAIAFVMPYIHHDRFQDYFDQMSIPDLQAYMSNLLIALRHVHSFGVIHRDVKPSNFLHDRKNQKYLLVDFGLAQTLEQLVKSTKLLLGGGDIGAASAACDKEHSEQASQPKIDDQSTSNAAIGAVEAEAVDSIQSAQTASENKRKASDVDGQCDAESNPPKRIRTLASSLTMSNTPPVGAAAAEANENSKAQQPPPEAAPRAQYIPTPFKAPLKQLNEISTPKNPKAGIAGDSPFTRHIKSAVLGYSLQTKLQAKTERGAGSPQTPPTPAAPGHKYNVDNRRTSSSGGGRCFCHGRPTVCNICLVKREMHAPRAGTPGYRPSEVLLKYPLQTTAVDMWATGVILISVLSGCYPFFKGPDDITALAEIITVFGDDVVKKTALSLGRQVCISRKKRPLHLRKLCIRLRNRCKMQNTPNDDHSNSTNVNKNCDNCEQMNSQCLCQDTDYNLDFSADSFPDSAYDLLAKLLAINPKNRITADEALQHPFFKEIY